MKVRVSGVARADIQEITDFIAADAPRRAASYAQQLKAACADLKDFPDRFQVALTVQGVAVRARPHGRHRIFYAVEEGDVLIPRVLDDARDFARLFGG